jgi:EmrB/QacA subfamily drug resistance transporter
MSKQSLTLLGSILGAIVVFLDAAVINVALPAIERDLGASFALQQWIVNAYLVTLGALLLVGGAIGDLYGRRRVFAAALIAFGATSMLCGLAPSPAWLVIGRAAQGVCGAVLTPSSLALVVGAFPDEAGRGRAIGRWTAWTGVAFVIGPLVGGALVETASWRWVFLLNVPFVLVTLALAARMPAELDARRAVPIDVPGATLATLGLGATVSGLIEGPRLGFGAPLIVGALIGGGALCAAFLVHQQRAANPMLPLSLFRRRGFAVGNAATFLIYGALSAQIFFLVLFLQQVAGYSPLASGLATLPISIIMFLLSPTMGALAGKRGPRLFLGAGPLIAAAGLLLYLRLDAGAPYVSQVLPAVVLFAVGLACIVAPLTATVLEGVEPTQAGLASGVNNAVARVAGLVAVAVLGALLSYRFAAVLDEHLAGVALDPPAQAVVGLAKERPLSVELRGEPGAARPALDDAVRAASVVGFHEVAGAAALLLIAGGVLAAVGLRRRS